jgi:hypothetical protein
MDFEAFHVVSTGVEGVLKLSFVESQRCPKPGAETAASTVELEVGKQEADFIGQYLGSAEVNRALPVAMTICKSVERAKAFVMIISPRGDYRARCGKEQPIVKDKGF